MENVAHPMQSASLREVFDYAALRLSQAIDEGMACREFLLATDRFDEAYMWMVAGETRLADRTNLT